jgi:hypothetical protein
LKKLNPGNTLSVAMDNLAAMTTDFPLYEHTELSWEGNLDELAFLMLIEACQCATSDEEDVAILDPKVTKIGISYRSHP